MRPQPVVITATLTGSRITKEQAPAIPVTPEEIAAEGIAAWRAGAAIVHVHVRDARGRGAQDMDAFRHVVGVLRAETDVILCLTTSGIPGRNLPSAERIAPLALQPEMASFDAGSIQMDAGRCGVGGQHPLPPRRARDRQRAARRTGGALAGEIETPVVWLRRTRSAARSASGRA